MYKRQVLAEEEGRGDAAFDRYDEIAAHVFVWDAKGPIAAGRIYPLGETTGLGPIVCAPEHRQAPFADLVLRILLDKAQTLAGDPILTYLRPGEESLYLPFGFERVREAEGGLAVYAVGRDRIRWHSACNEG